jgi:hypothetical protein
MLVIVKRALSHVLNLVVCVLTAVHQMCGHKLVHHCHFVVKLPIDSLVSQSPSLVSLSWFVFGPFLFEQREDES